MTEPRKIYLAATYSRNAEMRGARDVLESFGYEITSRWIDDPAVYDEGRLESDTAACGRFAEATLGDILGAETVISFTGGGGKGGRHVEFGLAVALGKRLVVVGPREHVFHTLPQVEWFPDWPRLVIAWSPLGAEAVASNA